MSTQKTILVVDDAEFILEGTATLLEFEGYTVFTAQDGLEGLEKANKHNPDMILCDVSMPNLDGFGLLELIRANAQTSDIPFIFLSARADKIDIRTGMGKGADDYLIKPFTREELISSIDAQWGKRSKILEKIKIRQERIERNLSFALPHEFRTPLNGIINSAGTIKNIGVTIEPDLLMELTDDILVSARRLQRITENFLFFAQIEAASNSIKLIEQLRSFKTDEPAAMAYDTAPIKAQKYNRLDDMVMDAEVTDFYINLSSQHYGKVLDELLDNAFKFSNEGTPVELLAWLKDDSFHLKITDKGIGMSQEEINSIAPFAQFGRFENEQQGIGLGLIIAKRTIELHGGYMLVKSEKGIGTSIEISIPAIMYLEYN